MFENVDEPQIKEMFWTEVKNDLYLWYTIFFNLGFNAHQVYFTHFEPSHSQGRVKTGDPGEKTLDHPHAELGLSLM